MRFILFVVIIAIILTISFQNSSENNSEISIPVKIHVIEDESGFYTSFRDEDNIRELLNQANRIWIQADIKFEIIEIVKTNVSFETIPNAINGNIEGLNHENYDPKVFNLFLTQSLNNINGLALFRINSALVADLTTVNDYRTTAHEFGHLLGLGHIPPDNRLMARGKNGELLTEEEIIFSRIVAEKFLELSK